MPVSPDPAAVQETVDWTAVRRLQDAYADIVTRRAWPELAEIFRPDVTVTVDTRDGRPTTLTGPEAVGSWIGAAIERFTFFEFVILSSRVFLRYGGDDDAAVARMYINEIRLDGEGRWTMAYGVYHDRFRRVDGRWWFTARQYHSLARTGADLDAFPLPSGNAFPR